MKVLTQFEGKPFLFEDPEFIISCSNPSTFSGAFTDMENALKKGFYLAGFFSYEAGYNFEKKLNKEKEYDFPLIYFGAYSKPQHRKIKLSGGEFINSVSGLQDSPQELKLNISRKEYSSDIRAIRDYIATGDVYQITYCIKLLFKYYGDPLSFYYRLLKEQPVPYPAYINTQKFDILSLSPELFISKKSGNLVTKPMKGTWPRGNDFFSDLIAPFRLKYDKKNRAENVMIADLLRNDLGRMGLGVKAPTLFEVARYKTLCQMTSTVTARVEKDLSIYKLFSSIFPSGSVTGAPKIRAMQIIDGLENDDRKIYTGAIGYITPGKDMFFNIPIRTILLEDNRAEMGIGGGIVWDSTDDSEWQEGLLKAKFVTDLSKTTFIPI